MLTIVFTLVPVFGIMFLGAVAHRQRILPNNAAVCLNQFIYWYSLPMLLFYLMASVELGHITLFPVLGTVLGMLVAQCLTMGLLYWLKLGWKESIVGGLTACFPNVAFMGLPVILLLYPGNNEAKAMAGLVALAPTFSLVLADVLLSLQGKQTAHGGKTLHNILRSLYTNPALIGATLGMVVSFGQMPLPDAFLHMAQMLGSASAPCALFCMGMSVAAQLSALRQARPAKKNANELSRESATEQIPKLTGELAEELVEELAEESALAPARKNHWGIQSIIVGVKLILTPLLVYIFSAAMGATGVSLATMVILSSMPAAIICHIIALKYGALEDGCANAVLLGTLFSIGSMSVVIALLQ